MVNTTERPRRACRGVLAALLVGAVLFSTAYGATIDVSVKTDGGNDGCMIASNSDTGTPFQLVKWRAFRLTDGKQWKSSSGPWTPQPKYYCGAIGISKDIQAKSAYVIFDSSLWSNRCMPLAGTCP